MLLSLTMGAFAVPIFLEGAAVIYLGNGILRQQWLPMMIAKSACAVGATYAVYMLVAIAATQGLPSNLSLPYALFMFVASAFQGYIFWSVSES